MSVRTWIGVALTTTVVCACGVSPARDGPVGPRQGARQISGDDIAQAGGTSAWDGLRFLLRPGIMTGRSSTRLRDGGRDEPRAYLDGARLGSLRALSAVHYSEITSMTYMDASTATLRYGTGHVGGAIVVVTRRGLRRDMPKD